jgi:prepilin-type N-terminal cleavage/methylation domain-containing protein
MVSGALMEPEERGGFTLVELPCDKLRVVSKCRHSAFTLVELLVVIAIIGVLIALLLPAVQAAREAARRSQCENNLKNLSLALQNYHGAKNQLPTSVSLWPEGPKPVSSLSGKGWILTVLPFLEQQALYDEFKSKLGFDGKMTSNQASPGLRSPTPWRGSLRCFNVPRTRRCKQLP